MYYHAVFYMGGRPHWWANYQLEDFIAEIILPFIEKHVITSTCEHRSSLLNLGATEYLTAYRTNAGVVTKGKSGADEIQAGEVCTDEVLEIARLRRSFAENRSILQTQFAPQKNQVFVIMKFNDKRLESAYAGVIKPIIRRHGYRCIRID